MKEKLLQFIGLILVFFTANSVFGQWVIMDGSKLPEEGDPVTWTKFRVTPGVTDIPASVLTTVEEDWEIEGNFILKYEDLVRAREGWETNLEGGGNAMTLVTRAKPSEAVWQVAPAQNEPHKVLGMYIYMANGTAQAQFELGYPDIFRTSNISSGGVNLPVRNINLDEWTIYRITLDGDSVNIYLNEDTVPFISGKGSANGNRRIRWGDYTNDLAGAYHDWFAWDLSGAYAPGEGTPLPSTLTGLPDEPPPASEWVVMDGSKLPEEGDPVEWTKFRVTPGITDVPQSVLTTVEEDWEIEGNFILRNEDLTGGRREGWETNLNITEPKGITIVTRAKPSDQIWTVAPNANEPHKVLGMYLHVASGTAQAQFELGYPDIFRPSNISSGGVNRGAVNITLDAWTIYRLTIDLTDSVNIYLNENPVPFMTGKASSTTASRIRWGDYTNDRAGTDYDWIAWHTGGAFAPKQGPALPVTLTGLDISISAKEKPHADMVFNIFPNPVNALARIKFSVEKHSQTRLDIIDISGRQVASLVNEMLSPGTYEATYNAVDLKPGIYLVKFQTGDMVKVGKLMKN